MTVAIRDRAATPRELAAIRRDGLGPGRPGITALAKLVGRSQGWLSLALRGRTKIRLRLSDIRRMRELVDAGRGQQ